MQRSMLLSSLLVVAAATANKQWISLDKDLQFQPHEDVDHNHNLRQLWGRDILKGVADSVFADGTETYYDEYAQAWRFLGFYQDCDACAEDDGAMDCVGNTVCQRYAMWAAYVDPNYEGNGAGEYMYYNRHTGSWNKEACQASSSSRCAKMDCHLASTHWKLLGIFKEAQYDAFLESLLQYQGDCVWTDEEYKFMQAVGGEGVQFPVECTAVEYDGDEELYYDTQPTAGGNMNVALYTDKQCSVLYTGDAFSIEDGFVPVASSSMSEELKAFNEALDAFKICQPCKAVDIASMINKNSVSNVNGDRYVNNNRNAQNDDNANDEEENGDDNAQDDDNANDAGFVCSAAVDDNSVNQCMVFRQNTNMKTASYRDIMLAESQGTVNGVHVGKNMLGEPYKKKHLWLSILLFLCSLALLIYAVMRLYHEDKIKSELKEPLVEQQSNKNARSTRSSNRESSSTRSSNYDRSTGSDGLVKDSTNKTSSDASVKSSGEKSTTKRGFWGRMRSNK